MMGRVIQDGWAASWWMVWSERVIAGLRSKRGKLEEAISTLMRWPDLKVRLVAIRSISCRRRSPGARTMPSMMFMARPSGWTSTSLAVQSLPDAEVSACRTTVSGPVTSTSWSRAGVV